MAKVFYKVSKNESENLAWILNRIFYNEQCGRKSYILSSSILSYADIFEAYYNTYGRVCPASIFSDKVELNGDSILCVHNLLGNFHCNILEVIRDNIDKCSYLYISLTGNQADCLQLCENTVKEYCE